MTLHCLEPWEFESLAPDAHRIAFKETRPTDINRHTRVLVVTENSVMLGYVTIIEMHADTVYMQFGGAFPSVKHTIHSSQAFRMVMDFLRENYLHITAKILNTNVPMIKFALREGMLINGCIFHERETYLHVAWTCAKNR